MAGPVIEEIGAAPSFDAEVAKEMLQKEALNRTGTSILSERENGERSKI